jgi:hypothetical protein
LLNRLSPEFYDERPDIPHQNECRILVGEMLLVLPLLEQEPNLYEVLVDKLLKLFFKLFADVHV